MLKTQPGKGLFSQVLKNNFYQIGRTQKVFETPQEALNVVSSLHKDLEFLQQFSFKKGIFDVKQWELQWRNNLYSSNNALKLEKLGELSQETRIPKSFVQELNERQVQFTPSSLQSAIIPKLLSGDIDAVVESEPFSGKTTALALTALFKSIREKNDDSFASSLGLPSFDSSKQININHELEVRSLILVSSRNQALNVYSIFQGLTQNKKINFVSLFADSESKNYDLLNASQRNVDILVATPSDIKNALKKKWISTTRLSTLIIDDANLLIQSENDNFKILSQILRVLPNANVRQTIVSGDYISDEMVEAIRPYLKPFNQDILLFKGKNAYYDNIEYEFIESSQKAQLLQSNLNQKTLIYTRNPVELIKSISSDKVDKVVNLALPSNELSQELKNNPNKFRDATIFVTNDEYGIGTNYIDSIQTVIHYDYESFGNVLARNSSLYSSSAQQDKQNIKSIVVYDSKDSLSKFAPFFESLKRKTPSNIINKGADELKLLRESETLGDKELLEDIITYNYKLENLYAKSFGAENLQSLRATQSKTLEEPSQWEWRNKTIYLNKQLLTNKEELFNILTSARESNEQRRQYKKEKQQKMKNAYLEKKRKRKEKKAEAEAEAESEE